MHKNDMLSEMDKLKNEIGSGIKKLSFRIGLKNEEAYIEAEQFGLGILEKQENMIVFSGLYRGIEARWEFRRLKNGITSKLFLSSGQPLHCLYVDSLVVEYGMEGESIGGWFIPTCGNDPWNVGMIRVKDYEKRKPEDKICGAFKDSLQNGLFLATCIPQKNIHTYSVEMKTDNLVNIIAKTAFTPGQSGNTELCSETTWVYAALCAREALNAYAGHIPMLYRDRKPPVGWCSWDYYYGDITLDKMIENMEEIRKDANLSEKIKYVSVDDGWQNAWGDWTSNERFPGGMERLGAEIAARGFIPGIWLAPIQVAKKTQTVVSHRDMLLKDDSGELANSDCSDNFVVDPTHPKGREFLLDLYKGLYNAGFRYFKVDFVATLLKMKNFHDKQAGPYDVLRELFAIIREAVTGESMILGCSLPSECGAGVADAGRIGIDIANHWNHIEWVADSMQMSYWLNKRVWINDPDFLVVRGNDTSFEKETEILKPVDGRDVERCWESWKSGPVFTLDEAKTWADLVSLSGGSVFLSDRISMLNQKGKELVYPCLEPTGVAAEPLDLCQSKFASFWLQELDTEYRLGIVNWSKEEKEISFGFEDYKLAVPCNVKELKTQNEISSIDCKLIIKLRPHASIIVNWSKTI